MIRALAQAHFQHTLLCRSRKGPTDHLLVHGCRDLEYEVSVTFVSLDQVNQIPIQGTPLNVPVHYIPLAYVDDHSL